MRPADEHKPLSFRGGGGSLGTGEHYPFSWPPGWFCSLNIHPPTHAASINGAPAVCQAPSQVLESQLGQDRGTPMAVSSPPTLPRPKSFLISAFCSH